MGNQNESVLKIILDEGTRPVVETLKDKDTSLFRELYDKTFFSIEQYLSSVGYEKGVEKDDSNAVDKKERIVKTDNPNNVIAFLGERGSGKTSCMLSVAQMLQDKNENNKIQIKNGDDVVNALASLNATRFVHVETIEPSFIDDKANVLELVIAKLFKTFKERVEKDCQNIDANLKHELIEYFQNVQKDLKYCQSDNSELDTIDSLIKLSSNVDLKQHLQKLIDTYLKFVTNDSNENKILLLAIDDIDLNTQYAYAMVEQIRKYLILPNLLILVSLKLDQLEQVLRNEFIKQFEKSLNYPKDNYPNDNNPLISDIQQMAERYIQKLIPLEHRIYMSDMEAAMNKPIDIFNGNISQLNDAEYSKVKEETRKFVLYLVEKKTEYRFYNKPGETNLLIPRNLRELVHLIIFLWKMDIGSRNLNRILFKKYFYNIWTKTHLSNEVFNLYDEICSVRDAKAINATVIKCLGGIIERNVKEKSKIIEEITNSKNYSYNISIADVVEVLHYIEQTIIGKEYLALCFAIKVHYNFKLLEYAEEIPSRGSLYESKQTEYEKDKYIFNDSVLNDFSDYALLIGGKFFHCDSSMLPTVGASRTINETNGRGQRMINGQALKKRAKEIASGKCLDVNTIRIVEYFALNTTITRYDGKESYRTKSEIWYYVEMPDRQKNICFDATSCIYNILNIKKMYDRIEEGLYEAVEKFDNDQPKENGKSLMSSITCKKTIDNIFDIENIIYRLRKDKPKSTGDDIETMIKFYNNIGNYDKDYPQFSFFKDIGEYLGKDKTVFRSIFDLGIVMPKWENQVSYSSDEVINAYRNENFDFWNDYKDLVESKVKEKEKWNEQELKDLHRLFRLKK